MSRWAAPDPLALPRLSRSKPGSHEQVAHVLRRGIISGRFTGGTRLVRSRVVGALGVSRSAVRDALRELAVEGLVRFDAAGVAVVHELCRRELDEVYELRKLLEPLAVARATNLATQQSLIEAVELVTAMHDTRDVTQWSELNTRFHSVLEGAGAGPHLAAILRNLRALSALYVTHSLLLEPDRVREANSEHREILEAVIANDPDAAADAVARHLDGTLRALLQVREVSGGSPAGR